MDLIVFLLYTGKLYRRMSKNFTIYKQFVKIIYELPNEGEVIINIMNFQNFFSLKFCYSLMEDKN